MMLRTERGDAAPAALWATGIMTGVAVLMAGIVASGREYTRERALIDEALIILNAARAYQADNAEPLSDYATAEEIGWPGTAKTDPVTGLPDPDAFCSDALNILAGGGGGPNYIAANYQASSQSLVAPGLLWITSCPQRAPGEPGPLRLQLTSFGAAEICAPRDPGDPPNTVDATPCPNPATARNLAGATAGTFLVAGAAGHDANIGGTNAYVDWTVWRGAEYPALNRLSEMLLWKDYDDAIGLGIEDAWRPTTAFSGIRLGGWWNGAATEWASTPPNLARFIGGVNQAEDIRGGGADGDGDGVPDDPDGRIDADDGAGPRPLAAPSATNIDGRSFAMFYRAARYDPFNGPNPLFALDEDPCPFQTNNIQGLPATAGAAPPVWIATVESLRMAFSGFTYDYDAERISVPNTTTDNETLMPIGWQVSDSGGPRAYKPEIEVDLMTVLEPFFLNQNAYDEIYCLPVVAQANVSSRGGGSFRWTAPVRGALNTSVQIPRSCRYTRSVAPGAGDTPLAAVPPPVRHTLAAIRLDQLARYRPAGGSAVPAVRLSATAYCPMPVVRGTAVASDRAWRTP